MHTPGPWRQVGAYIASANERVVARIAPPADATVVWADTVAGLETAANAALIAEAPELLMRLVACAEALAHCMGYDYAPVREARAAIAKATGRTP